MIIIVITKKVIEKANNWARSRLRNIELKKYDQLDNFSARILSFL